MIKNTKTKTHTVISYREKIEHAVTKALFMIGQNVHILTKPKIYCFLYYKSSIKNNKVLNTTKYTIKDYNKKSITNVFDIF